MRQKGRKWHKTYVFAGSTHTDAKESGSKMGENWQKRRNNLKNR